jgi:hypothetical protein
VPLEALEVKQSRLGDKSGRGVFAKADIPSGSYVAAETSPVLVNFMPATFKLTTTLEEEDIGDRLESFAYYIHAYGYQSRHFVIDCDSTLLYPNFLVVVLILPSTRVYRGSEKCLWTPALSLL